MYNADATPLSGIIEGAHKLLQPQTYACHLCVLTHNPFFEKKLWKQFRKNTTIPFDFFHKNDFLKQYRSKWLPNYNFPIILAQLDSELEIFMSPTEIEGFESLKAFKNAIEAKLEVYVENNS